jgi:hypothetical protein
MVECIERKGNKRESSYIGYKKITGQMHTMQITCRTGKHTHT